MVHIESRPLFLTPDIRDAIISNRCYNETKCLLVCLYLYKNSFNFNDDYIFHGYARLKTKFDILFTMTVNFQDLFLY